jgi:hypothetical protein
MVSQIAFLYFAYFAWGCLVLLPVVKLQEVGQGFYRFFGFACVALQTLAAGISIWMGPALGPNFHLAGLSLSASLFFTLCFTVALRIRVRWFLWGCFALAALSGLAAIAYFPWVGNHRWLLSAARAVSSALVLGAVTLAMMLGHWYLVTPKLSIDPLKRYAKAYILLTALVALELVLSYFLEGNGEAVELLGREDIFILFRVAWGLVVPLGMAYFIWATVAMRSTQSATGILYAAMVCTMMGEGMGLYLTLQTGVPF